ncbi:MAG: RagB/SusD family nutrient uptake outer membrane protein [Tannerella sp.]|jgi:hypothetical protein|nr:RagB/SusD family nutrient uptake outer membrane protein [Tannerella sp.]
MRIIYKSLVALGLATFITACDFTDLDPTDKVGEKDLFSSTTALEKGVTGAYSQMSLRTTIQVSAVLSDDVYKGGQNGGAGDDSYQWTYSVGTGDHNNLWTKYYRVINMVNRILDGADDVPANTEEEKKSKNNSIGTAMFMRAYTNFDLLRYFSDFEKRENYGVPYVLKPVTLETLGRNTVGESFDLMLKDLEECMPLLSQDTPADPVYVSKTAVKALLARIYLYQREYDKAYEYANAVLKEKPLAGRDHYAAIWADETNDDIIFKLKKSPGEEFIGTMFFSADNSSAFEPSTELIESYEEGDVRLTTFIGDGVDREGVEVKRVNKYKGTPENVGLADQKLLRSSEMMLIMIEAKIQTNDLDAANDLFNQLRAARIEGWTTQQYTSKDKMIEELLLERRRELCYEGHRFFDMRRYSMPIYKPVIKKTLDADNYRRIMPIPLAEMQGNPVIAQQQNPGY